MISATTSNPTDTSNVTYDAMDRAVEFSVTGESTEQIVYGPSGEKLALATSQTLVRAYVALPGGDEAVYEPGGLAYYQRMDWLGTARLNTWPNQSGPDVETADAPFGESYAETGATDREFAGMAQQQVTTGPYPLYDAMFRNYNPVWGRWLQPDSSVDEPVGPAGLAAASPMNPQSWNRYAYALNNPAIFADRWVWTAAARATRTSVPRTLSPAISTGTNRGFLSTVGTASS